MSAPIPAPREASEPSALESFARLEKALSEVEDPEVWEQMALLRRRLVREAREARALASPVAAPDGPVERMVDPHTGSLLQAGTVTRPVAAPRDQCGDWRKRPMDAEGAYAAGRGTLDDLMAARAAAAAAPRDQDGPLPEVASTGAEVEAIRRAGRAPRDDEQDAGREPYAFAVEMQNADGSWSREALCDEDSTAEDRERDVVLEGWNARVLPLFLRAALSAPRAPLDMAKHIERAYREGYADAGAPSLTVDSGWAAFLGRDNRDGYGYLYSPPSCGCTQQWLRCEEHRDESPAPRAPEQEAGREVDRCRAWKNGNRCALAGGHEGRHKAMTGRLMWWSEPAPVGCADCGLPYSDPGFADLVVPHDAWCRVSPTGNLSGLLCPTCLVRAAAKAGIETEGRFTSGPLSMTAEPGTYWQLVRLENGEERAFAAPRSTTEPDAGQDGEELEQLARLMEGLKRTPSGFRHPAARAITRTVEILRSLVRPTSSGPRV